MTTVILRSCAGCGGHWAGYRTNGNPWWCPDCWAGIMTNFDPQPGDVVKHVDRQCGPFSHLYVIERNGNTVTVQPIGFSDQQRIEPVGALMPS